MLVDAEAATESAAESGQYDCASSLDASNVSPGDAGQPADRRSGVQWRRVLVYGVLPGLALIMAMAAGYLKWYDLSAHDRRLAASESVRAASDGAIAMLSYRPETVEKDLNAARDRLTGTLRDSYSSLTRDVVIPGSKQKSISASATVPAAASVSAAPDHAVVLLFVDQTVVVGNDPATNTASRVRVMLDKVAGRWLISSFDPL
ncbi:outer membrane protein [Mycobacterium saskatchewanense]|uniref:Outer membrane protein n=1 Tax=Mycobacterium saskatchewanense TaxID=220927 RepID=A0AAJ3TVF0_9MYCO|nr:hypothetical protein AWC23_22030 [Mycobacterium saskatchewanense]BBX66440.1 outer membrane protein [Mycobacterium saskatchewanense]